MSVSRNIRSIWVTDYNKSIGDVSNWLDSGSGYGTIGARLASANPGAFLDRSSITGVREISVGGYFWGVSLLYTLNDVGGHTELNEDLTAGETTITLDGNGSFDGTTADPGYIIIEDEIIKYTGTSGSYDLTGCVRAQFDTTDVQHDGTAGTIYVYNWLRGVIQSIDYEPEDDVYAIRVATVRSVAGTEGSTLTISDYIINRFEFSKSVVDLVLYKDEEIPTTISGYVPGYE
tara:strand:- start:1325 stop:2020 length:696 start_codon:yes stop_codon:yes gene_type:complete